MTKLNENEIKILNAVKDEIVECTRSEFGISDDVKCEGFTKNQIKGYLSQLVQKKYIVIFTDEDYDGQMFLTDKAGEFIEDIEYFETY